MKNIAIVPGGRPLTEIGYKYKYRKFLGFIATKGDGNTELGDPYLSRLPGICSNISVRPVFCPHLLGRYFNSCNAIVNRNWVRKYGLALDKY